MIEKEAGEFDVATIRSQHQGRKVTGILKGRFCNIRARNVLEKIFGRIFCERLVGVGSFREHCAHERAVELGNGDMKSRLSKGSGRAGGIFGE
jgi:hypothetical protein